MASTAIPSISKKMKVKLFVNCENSHLEKVQVQLFTDDNKIFQLDKTNDPNLWEIEMHLRTLQPSEQIKMRLSVVEPHFNFFEEYDAINYRELVLGDTFLLPNQEMVYVYANKKNKLKPTQLDYNKILYHLISLPGKTLKSRFKDIKTVFKTFPCYLKQKEKFDIVYTLLKIIAYHEMDIDKARSIFCVLLIAVKYLDILLQNVNWIKNETYHKIMTAGFHIDANLEEVADEDMEHMYSTFYFLFLKIDIMNKCVMDYVCFVHSFIPPDVLLHHFHCMKTMFPVLVGPKHFDTLKTLFNKGKQFVSLLSELQHELTYEQLLTHLMQCFRKDESRSEVFQQTMRSFIDATKALIKDGREIEIIIESWQNARRVDFCIPDEIRELFQIEVQKCLCNYHEFKELNTKSEGFIFFYKEIISGNIFKTNKELYDLLYIVCHSENYHVQDMFTEILNFSYFKISLGDKEITTLCKKWIWQRSNCLTNKLQKSTYYKYLALHCLLQADVVKNKKFLVSSLSDFIFDSTKNMGKLEIFKYIDAIGKLMNEDLNCIVLEHIQKLLTKEDVKKANEIIAEMVPSSKPQIDIKLVAEVIILILQSTQDYYNINDGIGYFIKIMVSQNSFWKQITNASGNAVQHVLRSKEYEKHIHIIKKVVVLIEEGNILLYDFKPLNKKQEMFLDIVGNFTSHNESKMKSLFCEYDSCAGQIQIDIEMSISVLKMICKRVPQTVKFHLQYYQQKIIKCKEQFDAGKVSLSSIKNKTFLPETFSKTAQWIKNMKHFIFCQTFWNCIFSMSGIFDDIEKNTQIHTETEKAMQIIHRSFKVTELCIYWLQTDGYKCYKEKWTPFFKKDDVSLSDLKFLFRNVNDILLAIETAEKSFMEKIPPKTKRALEQYFNHFEYEEKVYVIGKCSVVFGIDLKNDLSVHMALQDYENLKAEKEEQLTLFKISKCLSTIDSFRLEGNLFHVCLVLAKSSKLISFLETIKDVDIGYLTDAVEEHSEQHIQESTVSDLIDVKRFIEPVLSAEPFDNAREVFERLEDAVSYCGIGKLLPGKIETCNQYVYSLQNLYRNIADRGEVTNEILRNIANEGVFCFCMTKGKSCDLKIIFKFHPGTHDLGKIEDLRSRALLIASAKNNTFARDVSKDFIFQALSLIELSLDICKLCSNLKSIGHISFSDYKEKKSGNDLIAMKTCLEKEQKEWTKVLNECREKYTIMKYLTGSRLLTIFSFLSKGDNEAHATVLLKFINHEFKNINGLRDKYKELNMLTDSIHSSKQLEAMSKALELITKAEHIPQCKFPKVTGTKKDAITPGVVKVGRACIIALETNSNLVHRVLLYLYYQNNSLLPKANNVLFCDANTEKDEILLLMRRSCLYPQELFTLINIQILQTELQTFIINEAHYYQQNDFKFKLAIICCGGKTHSFLEIFSSQVENCKPFTENQFSEVLTTLFPEVYLITSQLPGQGKTETIYQIACSKNLEVKTFHLSGVFDKESYIQQLHKLTLTEDHLLHIDLGDVEDAYRTDIFLFELIVMGYVSTCQSAFALPTKNVCIEFANLFSSRLREKFNTIFNFKQKHLVWENYKIIASQDTQSPMQVVCHYLKAVKENFNNMQDIDFKQLQALHQDQCIDLLSEHLDKMPNLSFAIMNVFLNVLARQLKKLTLSVYSKSHILECMLGKGRNAEIKTSMVNALVSVSRDFATRSVGTCIFEQHRSMGCKHNDIVTNMIQRIGNLQKWEESNHLFLLFNANNHTVAPFFKNINEVPSEIKDLFEKQLDKKLETITSNSDTDLLKLLENFTTKKPFEHSKKLLESYALTVDNFLKMILISLRTQAQVPVVLMGETGCGKTTLIRFLAKVCCIQLEVLSIHAGITEKQIYDFVARVNNKAKLLHAKTIWIFMDEINTCAHLGMIADIVCHHRLLGKKLSPKVSILAACNPYRLRAESAMSKTGLQNNQIKENDLSRLVYRVYPLPENLIDYVWDYGSLSSSDEMMYIERMVNKSSKNCFSNLFAELLAFSQSFMRKKKNNDYCTSLRDVDRCIHLAKWFYEFENKKPATSKSKFSDEKKLRVKCIILALTLGYYCRLDTALDRQEYREEIIITTKPYNLLWPKIEQDVKNMIHREQDFILDLMNLPSGIARNIALQENVFVMLHCILNHIPVFNIGKPGCSKSLSMQLIRSNLRGKDSSNDVFCDMPSLNCFSFQGSESCTSDGIVKVFQRAQNFQDYNKDKHVLSVVILDEIGLAGNSPFNPLKVLHNLLEPEGKPFPDVAVVGISNWALDAAKMNRGIHLARPDMNEEDLAETGKMISQSLMATSLRPFGSHDSETDGQNFELPLNAIASCFCEYASKQCHSNFHGLRDFYFFAKFISKNIWNKKKQHLSEEECVDNVLKYGLWRNFGGLAFDDVFQKFSKCFHNLPENNINPNLNKLIIENLRDKDARHLMLITTGDTALDELTTMLKTTKLKHQVIIGSHFQEDCTDDYNYCTLNKIILCMEQQLVLILKDLEVYGSLYDMLNQNYTVVGPRKNCRIAIGPYSNPMCYVNDGFKCIVLIDKSKLEYSDPPFLNRFEKQTFYQAGKLDREEEKVNKDIGTLLDAYSNIEDMDFDINSLLPHFSENLVPSLLLLLKQKKSSAKDSDTVLEQCMKILSCACHPEGILRIQHTNGWKLNPRLGETLQAFFFQLPIHNGLQHFIKCMCPEIDNNLRKNNQTENQSDKDLFGNSTKETSKKNKPNDFLVFTHSSYHLNLKESMKIPGIKIERLGSIKSEKQLCNVIEEYLASDDKLLLMQLRAGIDSIHLQMVKHLMETLRNNKLKSEEMSGRKRFMLVCHLQRTANRNTMTSMTYLSQWHIYTISNLEENNIDLSRLSKMNMTEVVNAFFEPEQLIRNSLSWVFVHFKYTNIENPIDHIEHLKAKISSSEFAINLLQSILMEHMSFICENESNWLLKLALDQHALYHSSTFNKVVDDKIRSTVRHILANAILQLEEMGIFDCIFKQIDLSVAKQSLFKEKVLENKNALKEILNLRSIPSKEGLGFFKCAASTIPFKFLLSRLLFQKVEEYKTEYMCFMENIQDQETRIVTEKSMMDINAMFTDKLDSKVWMLPNFEYAGCQADYVQDFVWMMLEKIPYSSKTNTAHKVFFWILKNLVDMKSTVIKPLTNVCIIIHSIVWCNWTLVLNVQTVVERSHQSFGLNLKNILTDFCNDEDFDVKKKEVNKLTSNFAKEGTDDAFDAIEIKAENTYKNILELNTNMATVKKSPMEKDGENKNGFDKKSITEKNSEDNQNLTDESSEDGNGNDNDTNINADYVMSFENIQQTGKEENINDKNISVLKYKKTKIDELSETDVEDIFDSSMSWVDSLVQQIVLETFPAKSSIISCHGDILKWYRNVRMFIAEMAQLVDMQLLDIVSFLTDFAVDIFVKYSNNLNWQYFLQLSKDIEINDFRVDTPDIILKFVDFFLELYNLNVVSEIDMQIIMSTFFEIAFQNLDKKYGSCNNSANNDNCPNNSCVITDLWPTLPLIYPIDPYLSTLRPVLEKMLYAMDTDNILEDELLKNLLTDIADMDVAKDIKSSLTFLVFDIIETQILPSLLPRNCFYQVKLYSEPLIRNFRTALEIYNKQSGPNLVEVAYIKYFLFMSMRLIVEKGINWEQEKIYMSAYQYICSVEAKNQKEICTTRLQQFYLLVIESLCDSKSARFSLKNVTFYGGDQSIAVYESMCKSPIMIYDMETYYQLVNDMRNDLVSGKIEKLMGYFDKCQQQKLDIIMVNGAILDLFLLDKLSLKEIKVPKGVLLNFLIQLKKMCNISSESENVMKKLSGIEDFSISKFQLHSETEYLQWHLVSFMAHLLLVTTSDNPASILFVSTFKLDKLQQMFLPSKWLNTPLHWNCGHVTCICGYRVTFNKHCVNCDKEPEPLQNYCHLQTCTQKPLNTLLLENSTSVGAETIIRMIMYGCFLNALAMDIECEAILASFFEMEKREQPENMFWISLIEDWNMLKTALFLSHNELCLFLHFILKCCRKIFADSECVNEKEVKQMFSDLAEKIDLFLQKRFDVIADLKKDFLKTAKISDLESEIKTTELRLIALPTLPNLQFEVSLFPSSKYPFLRYILRNFEYLKLPRHIMPILNWIKIICKFAGNRFLMSEVKNMRMHNIFDTESDITKCDTLKGYFHDFKDSWNFLCKQFSIKCAFKEIKLIESSSWANICMSFDETSIISQVLMHLVQVQNLIIDDILYLACHYGSNNSNLRQWYCKDGMAKIPWIRLKKTCNANLISIEIDDTILSFSAHQEGFYYGRKLLYNMDIIEKEITRLYFKEVAYIVPEKLETIVFLDETYKKSKDILVSIKNDISQEGIKAEMEYDIRSCQEEASQFSQLLPHLGTVLSLVVKTKGVPNCSLIEYIDHWKRIIPNHEEIKALLPKSEHSIELRHLVSLYMFLEQLNGENLFRTNQIPDDYTEDMPPEAKQILKDFTKDDIKLLQYTKSALFVFTHRCLQDETSAPHCNENLSNFLSDDSFWSLGTTIDKEKLRINFPTTPPLQMALSKLVPVTLKLTHVHATLVFLEEIIQHFASMKNQSRLMAIKTGSTTIKGKSKRKRQH